jgi:hypothetical protein
VTLVVLFFCLVVQEVPVVILAAALASVESNTDPRRAPANTSALVFFIFSHILNSFLGVRGASLSMLPLWGLL